MIRGMSIPTMIERIVTVIFVVMQRKVTVLIPRDL